MDVFIVIEELPDRASKIWGVYSTNELAQARAYSVKYESPHYADGMVFVECHKVEAE